jgi:hypothetical protein
MAFLSLLKIRSSMKCASQQTKKSLLTSMKMTEIRRKERIARSLRRKATTLRLLSLRLQSLKLNWKKD